jgi:hypothetical protein
MLDSQDCFYRISMTILEACNHIYNYFTENKKSHATVQEIITARCLVGESKEILNATIVAGLDSMVKSGILTKVSDQLWVLTKPLNQYSQQLEVNYVVSAAITSRLNSFLDIYEKPELYAETGNLNEKNLETICCALDILNQLLKETKDQTDSKEE